MAKFKKGDRVRCVKPDYSGERLFQIGETVVVHEIRDYTFEDDDGNILWTYRWELATPEPIPDTVTIGGVEYIRKPEPKHEWKFGDVAVHENYGVGIISCVHTDNEEIELQYNEGENNEWFPYSALTFIRRANLSI